MMLLLLLAETNFGNCLVVIGYFVDFDCRHCCYFDCEGHYDYHCDYGENLSHKHLRYVVPVFIHYWYDYDLNVMNVDVNGGKGMAVVMSLEDIDYLAYFDCLNLGTSLLYSFC